MAYCISDYDSLNSELVPKILILCMTYIIWNYKEYRFYDKTKVKEFWDVIKVSDQLTLS